ncbi:NAD(P)-dependent oxidoreductase [Eubacteriaceae bacterium ES3]|nr:NAD(P)-dependent oxidoreductase [Eubacteriaceae bacterium ES3]
MTKVLILTSKKRIEKFSDLSIIPNDWEFIYAEELEKDEKILEIGADADFIFADAIREISSKLIENMPKLKLIHSEGVGYNKIDLEAARKKNIYVCNNTAANSGAVAEQTILLMLALQRRLFEGDFLVRNGKQMQAKGSFILEGIPELASAHVGLIGLGAIGIETAKRLKAFGCKVSYFNRTPKPELEEKLGIASLSLQDLCKNCDIISLHLAVTPETTGIVNQELFSLMKPSALLINTARGELIVQEDLATALKNKNIAGAGLDTLYPEPVTLDNPLLNLPDPCHYKLIFAPHTAGTTIQAFEKMHQTVWSNFLAVTNNEYPINCVNGL